MKRSTTTSPITILPPRSGQQFTITHGDYRAVITELGATLRSLTYRGADVIVPWGPNDVVPCCNGQLLIPFPNRIEAGTYVFRGKSYQLPIDEHDRNTAIHGYGYRAYWTLVRLEEDLVELSWRVPDMVGYPFDVVVTSTCRLAGDGLHWSVSATNHGDEAAPWAMAIHPWLANGFDGYGDAIDGQNAQCTASIPADTHVTVDDNLIPTGTEPVDGTKYDLRTPTALTNQPFDDAWTDVHHDADGFTTAVFTRPDGMRITVTGDRSITSFQMCTGTGFPETAHPSGVAIEPQTAYANAFNTGRDLIALEPGATTDTHLRLAATYGPIDQGRGSVR